MPKNRKDTILDIIKENGFVTVKYLCEKLHYSTATINRDLNYLQNQKLIIRKCGGAEPIQQKYPPLLLRNEKMKDVKARLAKEAAKLITDNMTIFIDGSTTTQFIGKYLTEFKNLKVITNNMNLAVYLSDIGIEVFCLGGRIQEQPYVVGSFETTQQAATYNADILFFSTSSMTTDGKIKCGETFFTLYKVMLENSKAKVYLADSSKLNFKASRNFCDFREISTVISDYKFSDETKNAYSETEFIEVTPLKNVF